jgi:hypothetical protein
MLTLDYRVRPTSKQLWVELKSDFPNASVTAIVTADAKTASPVDEEVYSAMEKFGLLRHQLCLSVLPLACR